MLRDADPRLFASIYVVYGFTDMHYGIDSLAAIIENRLSFLCLYRTPCFYSAARDHLISPLFP